MKMRALLLLLLCVCGLRASGQQQPDPAVQLYQRLHDKVMKVKDYTADVRVRIDVDYLHVPVLKGKLYFKSPGKLRLERQNGISILPRNSSNMSLNSLLPGGDPTVIMAGYDSIGKIRVKVLQVIPKESSEIVLTKIWVDEGRLLTLRTETTMRENGTVRMDLTYGKFANLGLPDYVIFHLDVKEFSLPQGVAMDYDDGSAARTQQQKGKRHKGTIRIQYDSYQVNTGLSDAVFQRR